MRNKKILYLIVALVPFGITASIVIDAAKRATQIKRGTDLAGNPVSKSWWSLFIDLMGKKVSFWN